jgi:protein transport protein SEC24
MQSCLLYSHGDGTRRMRVHNLCLPISTNNKEIFESIDPEFLACFLATKSSHFIYKYSNIEKSMDKIENQFMNMITGYFTAQEYNNKNINDDMCKLILLFLGVMKLSLFNKNKASGYLNDIDLSNFFRLKIVRMTTEEILCFIYPRIYLLDNILNINIEDFPDTVNDSLEGINQGNIFLIDNGFYLTIYSKKNLEKNICKNLFGQDDYNKINFLEINENNIFEEENEENEVKIKIRNLIEYIREGKSLYQNLIFVFEDINDKDFLNEILIEDNFSKSYPCSYNKFYEKIKSKSYL